MERVWCNVVLNVSGGILCGENSFLKAILETVLRAIKSFILFDLFVLLFGISPKELIHSMKQFIGIKALFGMEFSNRIMVTLISLLDMQLLNK